MRKSVWVWLLGAQFALGQTEIMDTLIIGAETETAEPIDKDRIRVIEQGRDSSIADALKGDPEVHFNRKAAFGDNGDMIKIRGLGANRILLNLDGRNLNATGINGGHYIDFGTLPLDNIERIEILKGGILAEYGNNAQGGVINAITRKPTPKAYLSAFASIGGWDGANDFYNARLSYAQKKGPIGIAASVSHQKASAWLWNNDFVSDSLSAKLYGDLPAGGELILGYLYNKTDRGFSINNRKSTDPSSPDFNVAKNSDYPVSLGDTFASGGLNGALNWIGEGAGWVKTKTMIDLTYRQPVGESAALELIGWKNVEDRREKNYATPREMTAGQLADFNTLGINEGDLVMERTIESDRSYGYKAKATLFASDHEVLIGGEIKRQPMGDITADYVNQDYNKLYHNFSTDYTGKKGDTAVNMDAAFISDTVQVGEAWQLYMGLRHDRFEVARTNNDDPSNKLEDYDGSATTPKLALTRRFEGAGSLSLLAYQNYRTPGIPESYWHYAGFTGMNYANGTPLTDLAKPITAEKSNNAELIYRLSPTPNSRLKAAIFYSDIEDYIVFKFLRPTVQGAYNIDRAKLYGASLDGSVPIASGITLSGGFVKQESKKEGDALDPDKLGSKLDYVPDYRLLLGLQAQLGSQTAALIEARRIGEQVFQSSGTRIETLQAYTVVDFSLKHRFSKNLRGELFAQNLFDESYEEVFGYPAIGPNGGFSVQYTY